MIINIRSTSGAGKSTIVRVIMGLHRTRVAHKEHGRKQPIGYVCEHFDGGPSLAVVGHYETDCGGCDTISKMDRIFDLVRKAHDQGFNVLFEGLLISADVNRVAALHQDGLPLLVLAIDLPIAECLSRVNNRRRLKAERTGKEYKGDVNPKNTVSKHRGVVKSMDRLRRLGIDCAWGTNKGVIARIRKEVGV